MGRGSALRLSRPYRSVHYHLIGIAGAAMASLAGLLRDKGHRVTGSDQQAYPPMSDMLDELGIEYARSFNSRNLRPAPDRVVVGNAATRGNPEVEAVLERGLRYASSAATIRDEFLWGKHVVAVAGTHGKTTTAAILVWLLERAGLSPSFLVGGVVENFARSFRLNDSNHFVIEADEYDTAFFDKGPKMWHYLPRTAVLTNIEFDHADVYRDEAAYRFAFARFVNLVPANGALVAGWDSLLARGLAAGSRAPLASYGLETPDTAGHPRWRACGTRNVREKTVFEVSKDGRPLGSLETELTGEFNVRNCLAAIAAASAVGASWADIVEGLATFRERTAANGASRRSCRSDGHRRFCSPSNGRA